MSVCSARSSTTVARVPAEAPMSTVSFMGDFSFATKVYLHGDNDCGAVPNVNRLMPTT